jgi:glutathione S-transferase
MLYPALVTLLALVMYIWVMVNVARARSRYGIKAPAIIGNENFERYYRAQMNTLEQMIIFLPSLWICAHAISPKVASWLGVGWIIGRIVYALGYYKEAEKRHTGFTISMLCTTALLLGSFWGVGVRLLGR